MRLENQPNIFSLYTDQKLIKCSFNKISFFVLYFFQDLNVYETNKVLISDDYQPASHSYEEGLWGIERFYPFLNLRRIFGSKLANTESWIFSQFWKVRIQSQTTVKRGWKNCLLKWKMNCFLEMPRGKSCPIFSTVYQNMAIEVNLLALMKLVGKK